MERVRIGVGLGLAAVIAACEPPYPLPPDYEAIFETDRVVEWKIGLDEEERLKLGQCGGLPECQECTCDMDCWDEDRPADWRCVDGSCTIGYVEADLEVDGVLYERVGLRIMGKPRVKSSYRIRFNRFRSRQRFHGVKRVNLRNNRGDPTQLREALALELFREAGVPASRSSFVWVTIDEEPAGLYTLVEQVDKKFLEDRFGEDGGNLYSIEAGGLQVYEGRDLRSYPYFDELHELKTNEEAPDHAGLIELLRVLAEADDEELPEALEAVLDVDGALRALAVNSWLANMDSYPGTGDKLYIYQDSAGRFRWIPWDLNQAFGNYHGSKCTHFTDDLLELDPDEPTCMGPRPLVDRLLGAEALGQRYHEQLQALVDGALHPDAVQARMEALRDLVRLRAREDSLSGFEPEDFEAAFSQDVPPAGDPERVPGLIPFVQARDRRVREILEADRP
ncbi:MAG: CotH kinase family protein [Deltaproteobacteria bacterium]|nr:CotH kinase family protein [Deltaproteobacteria bacterium]